MIVYFGGTPFYFKRASFINTTGMNLKGFIGKYYAEELNVTYRFTETDGNLALSFEGNEIIPLIYGQKDEFGNGNRTLYSFKRDQNNQIIGVSVASQGSINNIEFKKIE